jgi:peptide/nickel transport system permease protein
MSVAVSETAGQFRRRSAGHPIATMVARRVAIGLLTLWLVSLLVFAATQVLPGNAAQAVLGRSATPERLAALEQELQLDRSAAAQYVDWISGVLRGDPGTSLASRTSVSSLVGPRVENSLVLVVLAGGIGTLLGLLIGIAAAARRDKPFDHVSAVGALVLTALPEFVIGITLVSLFASLVFHWLPAVSQIPPGESVLSQPDMLVLPVATLVLVVTPYAIRMTRAAMIDALESEYVEAATLKGLSRARVLLTHALPNALPAIVQVIGLILLYLAGGIVVVEFVFEYPGLGAGLVDAVSNRDIPTIQYIVLVLAAFYVVVNICTDVTTLLVTPRRRLPRR